VVFTSGGTEANNAALGAHLGERVLVSAVEHDSVLRARGDAGVLPVDEQGRVDLAALEAALTARAAPSLISVMLANNETGVVQPLPEIVSLAHRHGVRVHCDAVQAAGKLPISLPDLGGDLLTLSAHKLGGPQGVGALVIADERPVAPYLRGGGQERGYRAGTENVAGVSGFGVAAALAADDLAHMAEIARWRDRLEAEARRRAPDIVVHGEGAPRLPNTSCLGLPGVPAETQVMKMDLAGVAVSSGSACSSGKVHASHVLAAMGAAAPGEALRVSLGWNSQAVDVDRFVEVWGRIAARRDARRRATA
jgi:cysteine desulfurase